MKTIKDVLEKYEDTEITISVLLTEACTFECGHCMYECKKKPSPYISNYNLNAIKKQVKYLEAYGIPVCINLIGGEPTYNWSEFQRVWEEVMGWEVNVYMTTNGWWLKDVETSRKFFRIISPYIDFENGLSRIEEYNGTGICIRISNDEFHSEFHNEKLKGKDALDRRLNSLVGIDGELDIYNYYCSECENEVESRWCEQCGTDEYIEDEIVEFYPEPDPNDPYIYVESFDLSHSREWIIPNGRGADVSTMSAIQKYRGLEGKVENLSYLPNGKLMDCCGRGSWFEYGDVDDSPLLLLELVAEYFRDKKKTGVPANCWTCRNQAQLWADDNLVQKRKEGKYFNEHYDAWLKERYSIGWCIKLEEGEQNV